MKIASASPPVVFLLSGHTVVLLVAASVLPVGFSRCGRVPAPPWALTYLPACRPLSLPLSGLRPGLRESPHPPSRPSAYPPCVFRFLSLFSPPGLCPGLCEIPHPLSRPSARLVSSAFSLCFPRPACAPACADAPLRRDCVIPLSSFVPPPVCAPACMKARIPIKKRRPPRLWKPSVRPFAAPQGAKCFGCGRRGARFPAFVPGGRSPLVKTPAEAGAPGR